MIKSCLLVAALSLLPGCPLLEIQGSVDEVCATYHDIQVQPVPASLPMLSQDFAIDNLGSIDKLASLDSTLQFTRAELHATAGIADFSFVHGASLTIASGDPSSTLPTIKVFDCADCGAAEATLDIATTAQIDAKAYVSTGSLIVGVDLTGAAPTVAWTMDLDVCMSGKVAYSYSP
jgi:hypothetical protein